MQIPEQAAVVRIAFLPPMSGLAAQETRLDTGAVNVRLGEGKTAEVLRNLCYQVCFATDDSLRSRWSFIKGEIRRLFGVSLDDPSYIQERGEITMRYRDASRAPLDLSASGRGLQQTLLLLTYMSLNTRSVVLIDEPDAHLEILRQRQIYSLISDIARRETSQLVIASHSEVILNEAADQDVVVAFVGRPHRIDDRGSQLLKSLKDIGFDQYYQAEQRGWVLYLEGSTDLAILKSFARALGHEAQSNLETPFVCYVENQPQKARNHFYGLREVKPDLIGFALYDRITDPLQDDLPLRERKWRFREIENYLCQRETLIAWAKEEGDTHGAGPLFTSQWVHVMEQTIDEVMHAMETLGKGSPWSSDSKVSEDFLEPLFERFFRALGLPNLMRKTDYHRLAQYVPRELIDPEVVDVLGSICSVANAGQPVAEDPV
jgi:hypothetical protein